MNAIFLVIFSLFCFYLSIRYYGRFLDNKIFDMNSNEPTPAHRFRDGMDYVPTAKPVLFGHHFTSIAGASPIVGPAIAVIWGWIPAVLWIVLGSIFMGAVHDFGSLSISVKHDGSSIGNTAADIIKKRARTLFLFIVFFLIFFVLAVFAYIIATLFVQYPTTVIPINAQIIIAIIVGYLFYRKKIKILIPSLIALLFLYFFIWVGIKFPISIPPMLGISPLQIWIILLMIYSFIASVLPVWVLLQPRDYINSHQLIVGLSLMFIGVFVVNPKIVAPAVQASPEGAPLIIPFLFVTIACGAISGFHSLVSSGTTSKQLNKMIDGRTIGYGGMILEGCLALMALVAVSAGFSSRADWLTHYASWSQANSMGAKIGAFLIGGSRFLSALGIPEEFGVSLIGVLVIAFAATTLDTACRIQRYIISEIGKSYNIKLIQNRYLASGIAASSALALALIKGGGEGGLILWPLFGATNQLISGLALFVITVYLYKKGKPVIYTLIPMIFIALISTASMIFNLGKYINTHNWLLAVLGIIILGLEAWLISEGILVIRRRKIIKKQPTKRITEEIF
ncbi:MAG: carbon starvation protein A [Candidatus Helarchaeota archaeon]|nr:carbon starvation protein A [Candidatus Helarchaeota archaeon]